MAGSITTGDQTFATGGVGYVALAATGVTAPLTWSLNSAGSSTSSPTVLPGGDLNMVLRNSETAALIVQVVDSSSTPQTITKTINVTSNATLALTQIKRLPDCMLGCSYKKVIIFGANPGEWIAGGTGPYTLTATGLPAGLTVQTETVTISSVNYTNYYLGGRPTAAAGSYSVTLTGHDSASGAVSITIPIAVLAQDIQTRPSGNTGAGLFVKNAKIYDNQGARFIPRGLNRAHFDQTFPVNHPANCIRVSAYVPYVVGVSQMVADCQVHITAGQVPVLGIFNLPVWEMTGGISGTVLTVTAVLNGSIQVGDSVDGAIGGNINSPVPTISSFGTGSGGVGTYNLSNSQTVSSGSSIYSAPGSTGNTRSRDLQAAATWLAANVSSFSSVMNSMILNLANEWGPSNSSAWSTAYQSYISTLRTAGWTCPFMVDTGQSGQDIADLNTYSTAVFNSDPQANTIFSFHLYGNTPNVSTMQTYFAQLASLGASNGAAYVIGEFGPGRNIGPSPTLIDPISVISAAEANNLGWLAWAWDDNDQGGGVSDDNWFAMLNNVSSNFNTTSLLLEYGAQVVTSPGMSMWSLSQPASMFVGGSVASNSLTGSSATSTAGTMKPNDVDLLASMQATSSAGTLSPSSGYSATLSQAAAAALAGSLIAPSSLQLTGLYAQTQAGAVAPTGGAAPIGGSAGASSTPKTRRMEREYYATVNGKAVQVKTKEEAFKLSSRVEIRRVPRKH